MTESKKNIVDTTIKISVGVLVVVIIWLVTFGFRSGEVKTEIVSDVEKNEIAITLNKEEIKKLESVKVNKETFEIIVKGFTIAIKEQNEQLKEIKQEIKDLNNKIK